MYPKAVCADVIQKGARGIVVVLGGEGIVITKDNDPAPSACYSDVETTRTPSEPECALTICAYQRQNNDIILAALVTANT